MKFPPHSSPNKPVQIALCVLCLVPLTALFASDLLEVQPLTDRVLLLHFKDGTINYHQPDEPMEADKVTTDPLDVVTAAKPASYTIESADDPAFKSPQIPLSVGRKTKAMDFAKHNEKYVPSSPETGRGHSVNVKPDRVDEHFLYLELPARIQPGKTYRITTGSLARNGSEWKLTFDWAKSRSEAVHVNTLGYVPAAPEKFAYVYHWLGDKGSLVLPEAEKRSFSLLDTATGKSVFCGKLKFRRGKDNPETDQKKDTPNQNFLGADVWECEFSSFNRPGTYVVAVDGVGCSWPFRVDPDIYREPFQAVIRSLYHQRSGLALTKPYTDFERPAPDNVKLTPGFEKKLFYTTVRLSEFGSESGDPKVLQANFKGNLSETWGWYQDAGDWDGYYSHLEVPQLLLFAYEMAPKNFRTGELNIPESGNGLPDILNEAAWLPRYCQRLRKELREKGWGTGGLGMRVAPDGFGTPWIKKDGKMFLRASWQDDRIWVVSGEDPWSTYRYAGVAAHLAFCLQFAGVKDPQGVDWEREAREAYVWAQKNTRPGDEAVKKVWDGLTLKLKAPRAYAAAALFKLTGDANYEKQFLADTADIASSALVWGEIKYAVSLYALSGGKGVADPQALAKMRSAVLATADTTIVKPSAKRALRWGGSLGMMLCGQQTTPLVFEGAVGYIVAQESNHPEQARKILAGLYTTCDYFLGNNALNMTWITHVGPRFPRNIWHLDSLMSGRGTTPPGYIPYGPWRKANDIGVGPWDRDWPNSKLHPAIDSWPANERYFSNQYAPLESEFTIHENTAPAAAIFGFLCAEANASTPVAKPGLSVK